MVWSKDIEESRWKDIPIPEMYQRGLKSRRFTYRILIPANNESTEIEAAVLIDAPKAAKWLADFWGGRVERI